MGDIIVDRNINTRANTDSYRVVTCEVNGIDGTIQTVCELLLTKGVGNLHYYNFPPKDLIKRKMTLKRILKQL